MTQEQIIRKLLRNTERMEEQLAQIRMQIAIRGKSPWMNVEEAAIYCGYSKSALYSRYKNEIPHHQRDSRIMFHRDDLDRWMERNKKTPAVTGANS